MGMRGGGMEICSSLQYGVIRRLPLHKSQQGQQLISLVSPRQQQQQQVVCIESSILIKSPDDGTYLSMRLSLRTIVLVSLRTTLGRQDSINQLVQRYGGWGQDIFHGDFDLQWWRKKLKRGSREKEGGSTVAMQFFKNYTDSYLHKIIDLQHTLPKGLYHIPWNHFLGVRGISISAPIQLSPHATTKHTHSHPSVHSTLGRYVIPPPTPTPTPTQGSYSRFFCKYTQT